MITAPPQDAGGTEGVATVGIHRAIQGIVLANWALFNCRVITSISPSPGLETREKYRLALSL